MYRVVRFPENPIIYADLDPSIGQNINGPSLDSCTGLGAQSSRSILLVLRASSGEVYSNGLCRFDTWAMEDTPSWCIAIAGYGLS